MTAEQLLTSDIPLLRPIDNVKCALDMMDEYKLAHLPLVVEDHYKGLISEEDLLECDESAVLAEVDSKSLAVDPNLHLYEVVASMSNADVDLLPVVHRGIYRGSIDRSAVLCYLSRVVGWGARRPPFRGHNPPFKPPGPKGCLLYTSPSPRDRQKSRMPSSA